MPGPRNTKSKKKAQAKKQKRAQPTRDSFHTQPSTSLSTAHSTQNSRDDIPAHNLDTYTTEESLQVASPSLTDSAPAQHSIPSPALYYSSHSPHSQHPDNIFDHDQHLNDEDDTGASALLPQRPFIEDPGTGIRVRDTRAFLASRFAAPPSLDDDLCAEFAQEEVLQMLCSVLPEETALILWYNKSRQMARICPACQRLYRLGDILLDPLGPAEPHVDAQSEERISETRYREQHISGLCSPVCFILAAFHYPAAIRSTWGRMAEDLSDETWELLGIPPKGESNDMGLGMLLKMTRCHDLGLGQLLFPDLDLDEDGDSERDLQDEEEDQSDETHESAEGYEEEIPLATGGWQQDLKEAVMGLGGLDVRVAQEDDNEILRH